MRNFEFFNTCVYVLIIATKLEKRNPAKLMFLSDRSLKSAFKILIFRRAHPTKVCTKNSENLIRDSSKRKTWMISHGREIRHKRGVRNILLDCIRKVMPLFLMYKFLINEFYVPMLDEEKFSLKNARRVCVYVRLRKKSAFRSLQSYKIRKTFRTDTRESDFRNVYNPFYCLKTLITEISGL